MPNNLLQHVMASLPGWNTGVHMQQGCQWSPPEKWCFPMVMVPLNFPLSQEYVYISTNKVRLLLHYIHFKNQ